MAHVVQASHQAWAWLADCRLPEVAATNQFFVFAQEVIGQHHLAVAPIGEGLDLLNYVSKVSKRKALVFGLIALAQPFNELFSLLQCGALVRDVRDPFRDLIPRQFVIDPSGDAFAHRVTDRVEVDHHSLNVAVQLLMQVAIALMTQEVDAIAGADVEHERADVAHHAHAEAGNADVEPVAAAAWPCATPHLDAVLVHQLRVLVLGQVFCDSGGERCAFLLFHGLSPVRRRPPVAGGGNLVWVGVLRVTGMGPDPETKMELRNKFKKFMETVDQAALISLAVLGVVSFFLISTILMASSDVTKLGPVGDFFGGILNPILSFFAFIAVVITFRAQTASNLKSEQASNEVLKGQEQQLKQLVAQGALAERQAFENVLFGLIQHYSNNVSAVKLDFDDSSERGRDAFNALSVKFTVDGIDLTGHAAARPWQRIDAVYKRFSLFTEYDIGHCFRSAIQVVIYIDTTACFLQDEKRRYFDMFLSLVSMSEIKGLLFYTLSQQDLSEFDLLDKYGFLNWQTFNDRNALEVANYLSNRRDQIRHCQMMFND